MTSASSIDRAGLLVIVGVFVALVVDGMDLQILALALPGIARDLSLSTVRSGALSTQTLIGMGVGGVLSGWLADRIGRVRVVWWAIVVFSALTGAIAWCDTYWQVAVMRLLSGFGIGALYSIGTLLAAEYVPTRVRTTVLGTLQAGWSVGYVLAALLSAYVLPRFGWRPLFACAIVPGVIALGLLWTAPDPASWTHARGGSSGTAAGRSLRALWTDPSVRPIFLSWTAASMPRPSRRLTASVASGPRSRPCSSA